MQRASFHGWRSLGVLGLALAACGPVNPSLNQNNTNWNQNNTNWNQNANTNQVGTDGWVVGAVTVQGVVWSPGADQASVRASNKFPIPGAVVAAFTTPPPEAPDQTNCNCLEISDSVPSTLSDKVTGEFSLSLLPDRDYYLLVQKGEFRRVRMIHTPNTPNQVYRLESNPGDPTPPEITLPSRTEDTTGDMIPRIAIIDANYEDMSIMFEALGFDYDGEIDLITDVSGFLGSPTTLADYNLIIAPCGENWPGGNAAANLREYVRNGGKLYVDDFNYDFVEQVFPEFLSFYVSDGMFGGGAGPCGTGTSPSGAFNGCNNWSSYDFNGNPGDVDFAAWLALPSVNQGGGIHLQGAWDYLYELGQGVVGWDEDFNTEVLQMPKVWMHNADAVPWGPTNMPATVSFPYYCGKVLYTVYHTHSGSGVDPSQYDLLLQEKIMMYLILDINTCSTGPIVE
jgi:hypothetical protein